MEPFPKEENITNRIMGAGLARDVFFYPGGTGEEGAIIAMGPAFTITKEEIDKMLKVLLESISEVAGKIG